MADEFQTNFKRNTSFKFPNTSRANEYEFWALVEDPQRNLFSNRKSLKLKLYSV